MDAARHESGSQASVCPMSAAIGYGLLAESPMPNPARIVAIRIHLKYVTHQMIQ